MTLFIYLLLNCLSYFYWLTQLLLYVSLKILRSIGNTRYCIKLHITSWGNCFRCRIYRCRISYLLLINVINKLVSMLRQRESCPVGVEIAETYSEPSKISKMVLFTKTVKAFRSLTIFAKKNYFNVWQGSEYDSE